MKRQGRHYYETTIDWANQGDQPIVCVYTWYSGWKAPRENGRPIKPDEPAGATIIEVIWNGKDILQYMWDDQIEDLELACAESFRSMQEACEEDRAESIRKERLAW